MTKRIFVGYGQGGFITSPAMAGLADKLKPYGTVSLHNWEDFGNQIISHVRTFGGKDVACVGYSLSGSMLEYISGQIPGCRIALGVAIDPSKQFASARWLQSEHAYVQRASRFDRVICFWNPTSWVFGAAKFIGPNVEVHQLPFYVTHLMAQSLPSVWDTTISAVKGLTK